MTVTHDTPFKIGPSYTQDTIKNSGAFATKRLFQCSVAQFLQDVKDVFVDTMPAAARCSRFARNEVTLWVNDVVSCGHKRKNPTRTSWIFYGVGKEIRTLDLQSHNLAL